MFVLNGIIYFLLETDSSARYTILNLHFPPQHIYISLYCLQVSIAVIETSSATQVSIFYLLFLTAFKIVPLGGGNVWIRGLNILHIHCDVHRCGFLKNRVGTLSESED